MNQFARDSALVAAAALGLTACATQPDTGREPVVVRAKAPVKYEATVNSYFDFTAPPAPGPRKLSFGAPEASPCAIFGPGGRHASWVVPVIYDTSPPLVPTVASAATAAKPAVDKNGKPVAAKTPVKTAAASPPAKATGTASPSGGTAAVPLNEVSITGIRYFFWFSSETLSAVTRQADICP